MNTPLASDAQHGRLEHMPVSLFSVVMGLAGTTIAVEKTEHLWGWSIAPSSYLLAFTAMVYALIAFAYLAKFLFHRQHVIDEFNNPIRMSFFPTMSIGMLLLSIAALSRYPVISLYLWAIGSAAQLLFTLVILSTWMHHEKFQVQHSNPAWFIPIVGNILVPTAGVPMGFPEVSWFYFSFGIINVDAASSRVVEPIFLSPDVARQTCAHFVHSACTTSSRLHRMGQIAQRSHR